MVEAEGKAAHAADSEAKPAQAEAEVKSQKETAKEASLSLHSGVLAASLRSLDSLNSIQIEVVLTSAGESQSQTLCAAFLFVNGVNGDRALTEDGCAGLHRLIREIWGCS